MKILIIGQGIAGTILAWTLQKRGAKVLVADGDLPGASTPPAAGVINPVTGKRFVKSWRFEAFFQTALQVYQQMSEEQGQPLLTPTSIIRLLSTPAEVNDWSARCSQPDYQAYLAEPGQGTSWSGLLKPGFHFGEIRQAGRVDFPTLLAGFRTIWQKKDCFLSKSISAADAPAYLADFDKVVFCEGFRAVENPLFPNLNWRVAKGEALIIRFPQNPEAVTFQQMLKKTALVAPLGNGLFWVGGTYQWYFPDLEPSPTERAYLEEHLQQMIDVPYEIVRQIAAVRPTVKDRRPLMGESPVLPGVFLFNGLGTKGALLAPYWAEHFAGYLLDGSDLDPEVNLNRCYG